MLGHVGVSAREQQPEGRELRVGRPHLLPTQAPAAVLLLARSRLYGCQVRAGGRLGEELAPDLVRVQHRPQIARLLLIVAVGDDRGAEHAHADRVEDAGHLRAPYLLVADHLLDRTEALAAVLLRPGHPRQATLSELALPAAPRGDDRLLVGDRVGTGEHRRFRLVLFEPAPDLGAIGGLLGCVVEIHSVLLWLTGQSILNDKRYPT